jgi:OmcA/MtrC family decaheme c-type cytochrome
MTMEGIRNKLRSGTVARVGRVLLILAVAISLTGAKKSPYGIHDKAAYANQTVIDFLRPGLVVTINSASMGSDGTITAVYTLADPAGLNLDVNGVYTPGPITVSYISGYIPNNAEQYVTYNTRSSTGAAGTFNLPTGDSGGTVTLLNTGQYQYVFKTKAPAGFDPTATNTVAIYATRTLSSFGLTNNFASATYNFVPNGSKVTKIRDVVATASCDSCHDQLSFHGGARRGVALCVMCHTPAMVDATTGNSVDFKVFIHKLHLGSSLPSVTAGTPYLIGTTNFSNIVYPADARRCTTCHDATKATQANKYLTEPTAVACGSCHDDVNFATGKNHPGGPQIDDSQCANCHIPQGELDFDASITGAHVIPADSKMLDGVVVTLKGITNGLAGQKPVVAFTLTDTAGNGLAPSVLGSLSFTMAGPTTDYGTTNFGSTVTTPGYVTESALTASTCTAAGACTYNFSTPVPAKATGSYAIGVEARRTETLLPGTTSSMSVEYGAKNQVMYFSVDGSTVAPRRTVVAQANCMNCHVEFTTIHGGLRNNVEYCVMCHNPDNTDASTRPSATVAAQKALPAQGINFNLLVHRIHTGVNLPPQGASYTVVGFGGSINDFTTILYPAMSATGTPTDTRNCELCHTGGSEQTLPLGLLPTVSPQGLINPAPAITAACTGCHADAPSAAHFLANTDSLGESCTVCHSSTGQFSVSSVHAQY